LRGCASAKRSELVALELVWITHTQRRHGDEISRAMVARRSSCTVRRRRLDFPGGCRCGAYRHHNVDWLYPAVTSEAELPQNLRQSRITANAFRQDGTGRALSGRPLHHDRAQGDRGEQHSALRLANYLPTILCGIVFFLSVGVGSQRTPVALWLKYQTGLTNVMWRAWGFASACRCTRAEEEVIHVTPLLRSRLRFPARRRAPGFTDLYAFPSQGRRVSRS
jgi:hypothetical protein